jgi:hypothetical protein
MDLQSQLSATSRMVREKIPPHVVMGRHNREYLRSLLYLKTERLG